jgi:exopolysaccharide biosynthesis polyprenyl glycosylphosphotransferase
MTLTQGPTRTIPTQRPAPHHRPPRFRTPRVGLPRHGPPQFIRRTRLLRHRKLATLILLGFDLAAGAPLLTALPQLRPMLAAVFAVALLLLGHAGLFRPRLTLSVLDDLPLLGRALFAGLGVGLVYVVLAGDEGLLSDFVRMDLLLVGLLALARTTSYAVIRGLRVAGAITQRTVIVGATGLGPQIAMALFDYREHGLYPIGFVVDNSEEDTSDLLPVLGYLDGLARVVSENRADTVIIGTTNATDAEVVAAIRICDRTDVEIYAVPRLHQVQTTGGLVESLSGVPLVRLRRPAYRAITWRLKRVVDVVVAGVGCVLLSPVLLAVALTVVLDSGRPVLFKQIRVGRDGKHFWVLKFRTMRPANQAESATNWSIATDSRVTRVGRIMRRTSLDELAQLWNILRGDMTLVGPRPERPHFVDQFTLEHEEYVWRHRVPCGLTGWAQVNGLRGDTSILDRARLDNYYIENWSLWLDFKIMLRTLTQVLRAAGR